MSPLPLIITLLLGACAAYVPWRSRSAVHSTAIAVAVVAVLLSTSLGWHAVLTGTPRITEWWFIDAFSGLLTILISLLSLAAVIVSSGYLRTEEREHIVHLQQMRFYYASLHLFALGMLMTVLSNNIIILWLALESTTLSTTLLVAFYAKEGAIEAAWKYIVICSTGIALGLIGMLISMYAAATSVNLSGHALFLLSSLNENAAAFSPGVMRWAFVFVFVGIGTKVGLVPMHTWLPDAHSKTPSPVSALLSGILLNVALYTVLRFTFITDTALGSSSWTSGFFLTFGLFSITLSAFIIFSQENYKRLLAYSSIEHMGLLAFAIGLGPVGAVAAVMHMIGHAFAKSLLFFGAGDILLHWKSTKIANVRGIMHSTPVTGMLFLGGLLAILAVPPSPLFVSELLLVASGMSVHPVLTLLLLVLLTIVFVGFLRAAFRMLFSKPETPSVARQGLRWNRTQAIMLMELLALVAFSAFFMTNEGYQWATMIARCFTFSPSA
ncbi:MAG: proton-conducting transporter membrane subunit [Candidatus Peregrinibacteria bacterium]|nr:proton-conducting transporter membrane subunit [Candidatus Peregrinibacteria bacterium]